MVENLTVTGIIENLHYLSTDELDVIANHIEAEKYNKKLQAQRSRINDAIDALSALQLDMESFMVSVEIPAGTIPARWANLPVNIDSLLEGLEALR